MLQWLRFHTSWDKATFDGAESFLLNLARHVPTAITLFRLVLGPAFAAAYYRKMGGWVLLLLVVVAIFTDWLDGFLARHWNVVSTVGKLLDPFADALFCIVAFFCCWQAGLVPLWIILVLVGRETVVTFVLRPVALFRKVVIAASMWGKVKTSFQFGIIVTFVVLQMDSFFPEWFLLLLISLGFYIVLFLSVVSAAIYCRKVVAVLRQKSSPALEETSAHQ